MVRRKTQEGIPFTAFIDCLVDIIRDACPLSNPLDKRASVLEGILQDLGKEGEDATRETLEKQGWEVYWPREEGKQCLVDLFAYDDTTILLVSVKASSLDRFPAGLDADEKRFSCAARVVRQALVEAGLDECVAAVRYQVSMKQTRSGRWSVININTRNIILKS